MPSPSGATPKYDFPYLLESDTPDIATASQDLAQAVEAVISERVGVVEMFAGAAAPANAVLCQGQSLSTTTYAALFAVIGYAFGGSGGSFNVPDMRDKVPVGASGTEPLGSTGGSLSVTIATANLPAHTHNVSGNTGTESANHDHSTPSDTAYNNTASTLGLMNNGNTFAGVTFGAQVTAAENTTHTHPFSATTDAGTGTGSAMTLPRPPYVALNYIIWTN